MSFGSSNCPPLKNFKKNWNIIDKDEIEKQVGMAHAYFEHLQFKISASYFFDYYSYLQINRILKIVKY